MRLSFFLGTVLSVVLPTLTAALTVNDALSKSVSAYAHSKRDIVSEILDDIEDLAECSACEALLVVLQALAHLGNDAFTDTIVAICVALQIEDDDVCAGAIGLEGPILAHDLRNMDIPSKTAELFCLTIFGLCQWPAVDTSYSVSMSAKPANASRPEPSGETPIQIVHISDIHVDRNYTTGSSYNCTKNICCRAYDADDAVGVTDYPAGPYGNPECDSPVSLEESMYAAIVDLIPNRTFTIFTGDVIEGDVWETTDEEVTAGLNDAYGRMVSIGQTYAVVGNHDSCPVDSFPPAAVDTTYAAETQIFYDTLSSDIESWIGSTASAEVSSNYGSYSVVDSTTGLRIISINTNFWYKSNYWMYEETMEYDPSGMLAWLASELETAETAGERVWLLGHMPLGSSDTFHDQSYYFDTIIQRFSGTISAVFYGHTHKDEWEIAYTNYSNPTADTATMMSYIAPALTPTSGNPTFRVYDVDPVTFGILDSTTYYANISSPTYQTDGPTWEKLYSVKETYGALLGVTDPAAELTPGFWHNVTELFETDDTTFQQYYARKTRDYSTATCTGDCKTEEICQLRAAQAQYNCVAVSPGINLKRKRDDTIDGSVQNGHDDHACESSAVPPVLSSIYSDEGLAAFRTALIDVVGASFMNTTVSSNFTVTD
ncbi:sphingomyelin phosphodiesterase [Cryphonectria parasitica EP155]|uniref:Sphingomyelin phosphodiesterase n=1 Tax=Cryphonectria parasitica (strain ATCC 38755 / EP155) TaxID=660469 RepID=A0A9P4YEG5_CRYP1|nr:sphingomyelin phosphodiesterase [Cryphonectria parasitica EP155]KAF3771386.1 sphingomyelin phosphodiesterase [Cryphonectria parasitica EP155]